jgi:pilus assembly protein CpaB
MIRTILLIVALVSGAGALLLLLQQPEPVPEPIPVVAELPADGTTPEAEVEVEPPPLATVEILSTTRDIAVGDLVAETDFAWTPWPADFLPSGFVTQADDPEIIADLVGRAALLDLASGDPVLRNALVDPAPPTTRARVGDGSPLQTGMRAVPITLQLESSVVNVFTPGDIVDLVHVYFRDGQDTPVGTTLARGVRILDIEQVPMQVEAVGRNPFHTFVMELTPDDATRVLAASQVGRITFTLGGDSQSGVMPRADSISQSILPGFRAMMLTDVSLASGELMRVGDRIDILYTPAPGEGSASAESMVIVSNARVLELGRSEATVIMASDESASNAQPIGSVTVELDMRGTELVTSALMSGRVTLSLRSFSDMDQAYEVFDMPPDFPEVRVRRAGTL